MDTSLFQIALAGQELPMLSFHNQATLKATVLAQMLQHAQAAQLGAIQIHGLPLQLYGWVRPVDFATGASALGIPEALLRLGFYFFEGFPEDERAIRETVLLRREFITALPVGADLGLVVPEFLLWLLLDSTVAPTRLLENEALVEATWRTGEALTAGGPGTTTLEAAERAVARALSLAATAEEATVPERNRMMDQAMKKHGRSSPKQRSEWATLRVCVESAQALQNVLAYLKGAPSGAASALELLVRGASQGLSVLNADAHDGQLKSKLLHLLRDAEP